MTALFQLQNASVTYTGHTALHNVSLEIREGERVALLGKSGSGKSTLLNTLYKQQRIQSALVPQDSALVKTLTVFHNVYMGRLHQHSTLYNLRNLVKPASKERSSIQPLLDSLGLSNSINKRVGELSGGQQQRVAVARAAYQGKSILLGDEPFSAVDADQADAILTMLKQQHSTLVLALHDVPLALRHCSRVIGLVNGNVVIDQPTERVSTTELQKLYDDENNTVKKSLAA